MGGIVPESFTYRFVHLDKYPFERRQRLPVAIEWNSLNQYALYMVEQAHSEHSSTLLGGKAQMSQAITVNDATFDSEVIKSDTPVLVDFWAPWCGPCRVVGPILDEIAEEKNGSLKIVKVNVDENQGVAGQLGISSIPTMILYKNGQPVEKIIGAQPKNRILDTISPHVN